MAGVGCDSGHLVASTWASEAAVEARKEFDMSIVYHSAIAAVDEAVSYQRMDTTSSSSLL